jgi:hypothetical protein
VTDLSAEDLVAALRGNSPHAVATAIEEVKNEDRPAILRKPSDYGIQARKHKNCNLRKLKPKHVSIARMHCIGLSNLEISELTGFNACWISQTISQPIVKDYIQEHLLENIDQASEKSKGLQLRAVEAVSRALSSADTKHQLAAAKITIDMNQKTGVAKEDTAEDVIKRVVETMRSDGTRVRLTEERKRVIHVGT